MLTLAMRLGGLAAAAALAMPAAHAQTRIPLAMPAPGTEAMSANLDGHAGLYLFDSGLGTTLVTPATARTIGCTPWGKVTGFRAIGERLDLPRCNAGTLRIGPTARRMAQFTVLDLEKLIGPAGARLAGGIGLDAFDGQVVTLSVATHEVTIEDAASLARIARTAREVPIRLVRTSEGAALTADIGIRTDRGLLWMEIDTGNDGPSLIDQRAAPLLGLKPDPARQPLAASTPDGTRFGGTAIVRDLILDGDLGREALKDWDVTIDLARGRGWIRPAAVPATP